MSPLRRLLDAVPRGVRPGAGGPAAAEPVEAHGLGLAALADGRLRLTLRQLVLHRLRLQLGPAALEVERLVLNDARLDLTLPVGDAPFELHGLHAGEIELQGLRAELASTVHCALPEAEAWRLDAVGGTDGELHLFVTDAAWIIDADVRLPIRAGALDFNQVTVEHVGPNSSMGLSAGGVYIDSLRVGRSFLYLFTGGPVPGASFEQRVGRHATRVSDRGRLDLQAFLEGLLAPPGPAALGRAADRHVESRLDRTRLQGHLQLGDGALGTARQHLVLEGRAAGRNRVELSAAALGHRLMLRVPELAASGAAFELLGRPGRCGAIAADLRIVATRPRTSSCRPRVHLDAGRVALRDVALGEAVAGADAAPEGAADRPPGAAPAG